MREGNANGNWKGGTSSVKTADDIFSLPAKIVDVLKSRLLSSIKINKKTKCWEWQKALFSGRYARFSLGKGGITGHSASFAIFNKIKANGKPDHQKEGMEA